MRTNIYLKLERTTLDRFGLQISILQDGKMLQRINPLEPHNHGKNLQSYLELHNPGMNLLFYLVFLNPGRVSQY